jgi:3-deoxy-D-manno-octulosonic-acid transferase
MRSLFFFCYNVVVLPVFWTLLHVAKIFNDKVRRGIEGRENLFQKLADGTSSMNSRHRIWFHVSSMGEYEQAKPMIRALKERHPDWRVIVSFFSPSGYDNSKLGKLADFITYIPFDSTSNAKRFLDIVKPSLVIFVRYDLWPNHLLEIYRRGIPVLLVNATLAPDSRRLLPIIRQFHHYIFNMLTSICTVSNTDADAFRSLELHHPQIETIGDTRYDQVWQRSLEGKQKHLFTEHVLQGKKVIVAGSTWSEDEEVLLPALKQIIHTRNDILIVVVPHEPTLNTLERLERLFENGKRCIRFSDMNDYDDEPVVVVDSVGILMGLYQYANVAYVGGSFKQGIHNVLEPAIYGIPVIFGPVYTNSQEALLLVQLGGASVIHTSEECYQTLSTLLDSKEIQEKMGSIALSLVKNHIGATEKLIAHIEALLSTPSTP